MISSIFSTMFTQAGHWMVFALLTVLQGGIVFSVMWFSFRNESAETAARRTGDTRLHDPETLPDLGPSLNASARSSRPAVRRDGEDARSSSWLHQTA